MEESRALIIVDVQPTFCEGGALAIEGGNALAEKIADFVTECSDEYAFIVTTQDWHIDPGAHFSDTPDFVDTWPPHGVAGTPEAELHEAIASLSFDASVKKGQYEAAYSGFEGKDADARSLEEVLRDAEIGAVDVVGLAESHCVKETALDALRAGWPTRVLSDLTLAVSAETGEAARVEMDEAGVEQITSSEAFGFYEEGEDVPIPGDLEAGNDFGGEDFGGADLDAGGLDDAEDTADLDGDDFDAEAGSLVAQVPGRAGTSGSEGTVTKDPEDIDLAEFGLDDIDLDEDIDFSDEVDEADFDFSDIDPTL
ncbi:MAG: isochorismatase family protein [Actinomycetaceae bacterium]|nr:isochorismatase family protein [Actinomycetaceae bacterium]